MKRREFLMLFAGATAMRPLAARAQQVPRRQRVGVLIPYSESDSDSKIQFAAFRDAMRQLGWKEGENLETEILWTGGDGNKIGALAKQLVASQPDVILARSTAVTKALQTETQSIPLVFVIVSDPVGDGFVDSMSRPGRNATGFTNVEASLGGKWLELLRDMTPRVKRVAVVFGKTTSAGGGGYYFQLIESAAKSMNVEVIRAPIQSASDAQQAVSAFAGEPNGGLIVTPDATTTLQRKPIIEAALTQQIPAIFPFRFMADEGGLASYGVDIADIYRRSAGYVDRILRGDKPNDLAVQAPTKFELAINMRTAKALGLSVPPSLLATADEVIE
jgi:putative ABC transport system substrate-binding protein